MAIESEKTFSLKFSGDTKSLNKSFSEAKDKVKEFNKTLNERVGTTALDLIELQAKAGIRPLKDLQRALAETIGQAKTAQRVNPDIANEKVIAQSVIRLKQLRQEMVEVKKEATGLVKSIEGVGSQINQAFLPLAAISATLGALFGSSVIGFGQFEKTLNTIKAVSQATASEINRIREASLELGAKTIFSNKEVADSFQELAKAGFTAQESLAAMPGLLTLAAAAGGDLETAASIVSSSLKAFKLDAEQTGRFVDVLAMAANQSAADITDLGFAFKQVAPIAATTGQSLEDMSALLAILANNAIKGGDAGSDLRNIITRLLDPSKEAQGVLSKLNVSLKDQEGNVKPLVGLFQELNDKFSKLTPAARAQAASILAGQENLKSFLTLVGTAPAELDRMVLSMRLSAGAAEDMANTINQGVTKSMDEFQGSAETLQTTLGQSLAPGFNQVVKALTGFINILNENQALTAFVAGAGAAAAALIALTAATTAAYGALSTLVTILVGLTGPIGFTAIAASVGILVTTFGALSAASANLAENARLVSRSLSEVRGEVQDNTRAFIAETAGLEDTAQAYDELSKKTRITKDEKLLMEDALSRLIRKFPQLNQPIEDLIKRYGSLSNAIREARIEQAALLREQTIKKKLEETDTAIQRELRNSSTPFVSGEAFVPPIINEKNINSLKKQKEEYLKLLKNVNTDVKKQFDTFDAEVRADAKKREAAFSGTQNTSFAKEKKGRATKDLTSQRNQFKSLVETLESEITGFEAGEFEKRRKEAQKSYNERIRQIDQLAKKAKISEAEITDARTKAGQAYRLSLTRIGEEDLNSIRDRSRTVQVLQDSLEQLRAELTADPFDDLDAKLNATINTIEDDFSRALFEAKRAFNFQTDNAELQQAERALEERKNLQIRKAQDAANQERILRLSEQKKLMAEILAAEARLSGDRIEIARAQHAAIIRDLETQFFQLTSSGLPEDVLKQRLEKIRADIDAANADADREDLDNTIQLSETIIAISEKRLELEGRRLEIIREIRSEQEFYLQQLLRELNNTKLTVEKRAELLGRVDTLAEKLSATSPFGVFLDSLDSIRLPNNQFDRFFKSAVEGLKRLQKQFNIFNNDPATSGQGFAGFFKANVKEIVGTTAGTFSSALGGLQKTTNRLGKTIGEAVGGLATALTGIPFLDSVGGFIGGLFGGGGDKKALEAQKRLQETQEFVNKLLAETNTNDLRSLTKSLREVNNFDTGGGEAFKVKKQTAQQLRKAIAERKRVIAETIAELQTQNADLAKQFQITPGEDFRNARIEREIQIAQLDRETEKAKKNFADSKEAQDAIERNAQLRRQLLYKTSAESIIATVIEEQNKIRDLRAQTAIDTARASDNAIALINAELQARLVAIENDIAAYQGAEEFKNDFLKAKAAEREATIRDSQRRIDDLLQGGLDILNEGLVVAETKSENQARRLQKLFGTNLNPFGELTTTGNLLQTSVTVGAGAFNFVLQGINDAQSFISQLNDPVIQTRLVAAVSAALARQGG